MKKLLIVVSCVIGLISVFAGAMFLSLSQDMKDIRTVQINDIAIKDLNDGIYKGEYYYKDQIGATVEVTVENGLLKNIEISNHLYGFGGKAEYITNDMISEQSILVDDIAGATTSSHVLKLAVQNALEE